MKLSEIQTPTIEQIIAKFRAENAEDIEYGNERDNCGFVASSFSQFAKTNGLNVPRIHGVFELDGPEFDIKNFKSDEIREMQDEGYDIYSQEDRESYASNHNLLDELSVVNHYWNQYNGSNIDFSGKAQFIDSGLASDLDSWRYKPHTK